MSHMKMRKSRLLTAVFLGASLSVNIRRGNIGSTYTARLSPRKRLRRATYRSPPPSHPTIPSSSTQLARIPCHVSGDLSVPSFSMLVDQKPSEKPSLPRVAPTKQSAVDSSSPDQAVERARIKIDMTVVTAVDERLKRLEGDVLPKKDGEGRWIIQPGWHFERKESQSGAKKIDYTIYAPEGLDRPVVSQ